MCGMCYPDSDVDTGVASYHLLRVAPKRRFVLAHIPDYFIAQNIAQDKEKGTFPCVRVENHVDPGRNFHYNQLVRRHLSFLLYASGKYVTETDHADQQRED